MDDMFLKREATIIGNHRYDLRRTWETSKLTLAVVMLNPSTADHRNEDPTLRRLMRFGDSWGYGSIHIVNLYAWRSPHPAAMFKENDRIGAQNRRYLDGACSIASKNGTKLLVAWGNHGDFEGRAKAFSDRAKNEFNLELVCLGITKSGAPKHPMARGKHRILDSQEPITWDCSINHRELS